MNERREKIHIEHPLPKARRCQLLEVPRSTAYYQPTPLSTQDLVLMRLIDEIHLQYPFYGSRRLCNELEDRGQTVNRKRIQRRMGLCRPCTRDGEQASLGRGTRYIRTCYAACQSSVRTTSGRQTSPISRWRRGS